jgi:acyl carrier protein
MEFTASQIKSAIDRLELHPNSTILIDDIPLKNQGIDSLDLVNLFLFFEETLGIQISDDEIASSESIKDIAALISQKLES